jgi:hypothetical protein
MSMTTAGGSDEKSPAWLGSAVHAGSATARASAASAARYTVSTVRAVFGGIPDPEHGAVAACRENRLAAATILRLTGPCRLGCCDAQAAAIATRHAGRIARIARRGDIQSTTRVPPLAVRCA